MKLRFFTICVLSFVISWACTPSLEKQSIDLKELGTGKKLDDIKVAGQLTTLKHGKQQIEFLKCQRSPQANWVLVANDDFTAFAADGCQSQLLQAFLTNNYNVAAINRPGYGRSTPASKDFGGRSSQEAIVAVAKQLKNVDGAFGIGTGAVAAAFASRRISKLKWLMLGNIIADMEQFTAQSTSPRYNQLLSTISDRTSEQFAEERSIAWDSQGLPDKVLLFHSMDNVEIPFTQSQYLFDRLSTEQRWTRLEKVSGATADIPADKMRHVIEALITQLDS